jgi:hypothetical protein
LKYHKIHKTLQKLSPNLSLETRWGLKVKFLTIKPNVKVMKKSLQRLGIATVGLSLCLWSCKEQTQVQPSDDVTILSSVEYNSRLEDVAKALAISMKEKSVRRFIKEEALKKFDGDYDILYGQIESKQIEGRNFESILATNTNSGKSTKVDAVNNLRQTQKLIPLLNIAVPGKIEKWDTDNYSPVVVVLPEDYSEQKTTKLKAFKSDGTFTFIDAKVIPNEPVIVITENERTLFEKGVYKVRSDISKASSFQNYDSGDFKLIRNSDKGAKITSTLGYASGQILYLQQIYCPDISVYESYWLGGPELQMKVFGATFGGSTLNQLRDTGEMATLPRIFPLVTPPYNLSIISWTSDIRDGLKFWFNEIDGGPIREITLSSTYGATVTPVSASQTFSIKINLGLDDDIIGEYFVDRNSGAPWSMYGYQCYDINSNFYFSLRN